MSDETSVARVPKPESLEAKFKLLSLLPYEKRAKRKHSLVYGFILDWYHSKYGDALASVRHIAEHLKDRDPSGRGLFTGDVHSAISDLVSWGYLIQEKGSGRRASRYVPKWDLVCSVRKIPNTTEDGISVRESPNADVRETPNATGDSVRESLNEDPLTPTRALDPETGVERIECAAPTAPPAAGLSAATAGTAQDANIEPFEQLWRVYDYKRQKKEARAAYAKRSPSPELHATMIEAATAWRESWAAQNKPDAPRYSLAKWIEREDYECAPPTAYKPKERKAKTSSTPATVKGNVSSLLRIKNVREEGGVMFDDYTVHLSLDGDGGSVEHILRVFSKGDPAEDFDAYKKLADAMGSKVDSWLGRRTRLVLDGNRLVDALPQPMPRRTVEIEEANVVDRGGRRSIEARLTDADGNAEGILKIVLESRDKGEQDKGQAQLNSLMAAIGIQTTEDTDDLLFRPFIITEAGDFKPAAANDNLPIRRAA
ncbi:MAG: hypothetical protein ABIK36_06430 [Pseudomonadota bacterium]